MPHVVDSKAINGLIEIVQRRGPEPAAAAARLLQALAECACPPVPAFQVSASCFDVKCGLSRFDTDIAALSARRSAQEFSSD